MRSPHASRRCSVLPLIKVATLMGVFVTCSLARAAPVAEPTANPRATLAVITPNGGEVWTANESYAVIAECSYVPLNTGPFHAWLMRGSEAAAYIGASGPFNSYPHNQELVYEWAICEFVGDGADYTVMVACWDCNPLLADFSDAPFSIVGSTPRPTFELTAPAFEDVWAAGSIATITWDVTNPHGCAEFWLYDGSHCEAFIGHTPLADGTLDWHVPPYVADGDHYTVLMRWVDCCGPLLTHQTERFTITGAPPTPSITLLAPNGGEVLAADTTPTITWEADNPQGDVEIWLFDGDHRYDFLGLAPMAACSFDWPILPCRAASDEYQVELRWTEGLGVADMSDEPFAIDGTTMPTINVTSPVPGEVWTAGSPLTVTWDDPNGLPVNGEVAIALYRDDACYLDMGTAPIAAGSFTWGVPAAVGDDSSYAVSIYLADCAVEGRSATFALVGSVTPTLTLTSPAGGEVWEAGEPYTITWDSTGLTGNIDIYLPNDGWFHSGHAVVPAAAGQFTWPIAPTLTWPPPDNNPGGVWLWARDDGPALTVRGDVFGIVPGSGLPADLDGDLDVDLADLAAAQACFTGWGATVLGPVCDSFDFDVDGDVDSVDWSLVADAMTGP